jgi:hypothetical protein
MVATKVFTHTVYAPASLRYHLATGIALIAKRRMCPGRRLYRSATMRGTMRGRPKTQGKGLIK